MPLKIANVLCHWRMKGMSKVPGNEKTHSTFHVTKEANNAWQIR